MVLQDHSNKESRSYPEAHWIDSRLGRCMADNRCSPDACGLVHDAGGMQDGADASLHQGCPTFAHRGWSACAQHILDYSGRATSEDASREGVAIEGRSLDAGQFVNMNPDSCKHLHRVFSVGNKYGSQKYRRPSMTSCRTPGASTGPSCCRWIAALPGILHSTSS